jgi:uncharacterized protein YifN (PemK superfamily)
MLPSSAVTICARRQKKALPKASSSLGDRIPVCMRTLSPCINCFALIGVTHVSQKFSTSIAATVQKALDDQKRAMGVMDSAFPQTMAATVQKALDDQKRAMSLIDVAFPQDMAAAAQKALDDQKRIAGMSDVAFPKTMAASIQKALDDRKRAMGLMDVAFPQTLAAAAQKALDDQKRIAGMSDVAFPKTMAASIQKVLDDRKRAMGLTDVAFPQTLAAAAQKALDDQKRIAGMSDVAFSRVQRLFVENYQLSESIRHKLDINTTQNSVKKQHQQEAVSLAYGVFEREIVSQQEDEEKLLDTSDVLESAWNDFNEKVSVLEQVTNDVLRSISENSSDLVLSDDELLSLDNIAKQYSISSKPPSYNANLLIRLVDLLSYLGDESRKALTPALKSILNLLYTHYHTLFVATFVGCLLLFLQPMMSSYQRYRQGVEAFQSMPHRRVKNEFDLLVTSVVYRDCIVNTIENGRQAESRNVSAGTNVAIIAKNKQSYEIRWIDDGKYYQGWIPSSNLKFPKRQSR